MAGGDALGPVLDRPGGRVAAVDDDGAGAPGPNRPRRRCPGAGPRPRRRPTSRTPKSIERPNSRCCGAVLRWGAITAIAVVQTEYKAARTTARDQFVGAAIGGGIGVAVVAATGQHLVSYVVAVVVSVLASWMLNVATAARLSGVTATIIMVVPHAGSPQSEMMARVSEVAWGLSVAIAVVWLTGRLGLVSGGKKAGGAPGHAPAK